MNDILLVGNNITDIWLWVSYPQHRPETNEIHICTSLSEQRLNIMLHANKDRRRQSPAVLRLCSKNVYMSKPNSGSAY